MKHSDGSAADYINDNWIGFFSRVHCIFFMESKLHKSHASISLHCRYNNLFADNFFLVNKSRRQTENFRWKWNDLQVTRFSCVRQKAKHIFARRKKQQRWDGLFDPETRIRCKITRWKSSSITNKCVKYKHRLRWATFLERAIIMCLNT